MAIVLIEGYVTVRHLKEGLRLPLPLLLRHFFSCVKALLHCFNSKIAYVLMVVIVMIFTLD